MKIKTHTVNDIGDLALTDGAAKFLKLTLPVSNPPTCQLEFLKTGNVSLTVSFRRIAPSEAEKELKINPPLLCNDEIYHDLSDYDSFRLRGDIDPTELEAILDIK